MWDFNMVSLCNNKRYWKLTRKLILSHFDLFCYFSCFFSSFIIEINALLVLSVLLVHHFLFVKAFSKLWENPFRKFAYNQLIVTKPSIIQYMTWLILSELTRSQTLDTIFNGSKVIISPLSYINIYQNSGLENTSH